jgi:signal transduction histidine kinase
MRRAQIERISVRMALAIGFCATLGLWLYTSYTVNQRISAAQSDAAGVAARYMRAQELLSTVRAQVLLSSVRVRDALLSPEAGALTDYRDQIEASYRISMMALADYEPVFLGSGGEREQLRNLEREVQQLHVSSAEVLAGAAGRSPSAIRELLNRYIAPRREAAIAFSEEIQALNRRAFVQQQVEIADIHRAAEQRSRRSLGMALVIGLGVLLITSLYAGRLESRLRHQMERDARLSQELQEASAKLIAAQEEERRTIARELHDEVGQALTALKVELEVAQRSIAAGAPASELGEAQGIADGALKTVRNLTQLLHPAALDDLGLVPAIDSSLRGLARRQEIRAQLHQHDLPDRLPREVELAAYRIVQEAITNVGKHANATRCDVHLTQLPDRLLIEVEDDGIGFVDDIDRPIIARGLGLISVRERASRLGGTFNIVSEPGHGTRLIVSLPERSAALAET